MAPTTSGCSACCSSKAGAEVTLAQNGQEAVDQVLAAQTADPDAQPGRADRSTSS